MLSAALRIFAPAYCCLLNYVSDCSGYLLENIHCVVWATCLSEVLYAMMHTGALLTTYFILGHIAFNILVSYMFELSPWIFVVKDDFHLIFV